MSVEFSGLLIMVRGARNGRESPRGTVGHAVEISGATSVSRRANRFGVLSGAEVRAESVGEVET